VEDVISDILAGPEASILGSVLRCNLKTLRVVKMGAPEGGALPVISQQ